MYILNIDKERCKSCLYCVATCKKDVLQVSDQGNSKGYRYIEVKNSENCVGCKMCAVVCPDVAIEILKEA